MAKTKKTETPAQRPERSRVQITQGNVLVMDLLMSGDWLQASIPDEKMQEINEKYHISANLVYTTLSKMERMGYIVGYIPLVTEDGMRILDAMKQMYGLSKTRSLTDMVSE